MDLYQTLSSSILLARLYVVWLNFPFEFIELSFIEKIP